MNPLDQQPMTEPSSASVLAELRGGAGNEPAEADGFAAELAAAKPARRVSMTNVVIAIVVVVSAASLYLMRQQGKGAGMTFQVTRIDYQLDEAQKAEQSKTAEVLAALARFSSPSQIPVDRIHKNPFSLEVNNQGPYESEFDRHRLAEQERRQLTSRFSALELNGVMGGPVPLARISGRTVRVGDTIGEMFTVKAIHSRSVELSAHGEMFVLEMGDSAETAPRRRPAPRR